jgi:hypothetical protein
MHHSFSFRTATNRALCVVVVSTVGMISAASISFGDVPQSAVAVDGPVGATTIVGMTVATLAWAVAGLAFLAIGLFAASKSGRRVPAASAGTAPVALSGTTARVASDLDQAALAS